MHQVADMIQSKYMMEIQQVLLRLDRPMDTVEVPYLHL